MADELTIEGKDYVSSKRASQLSHYTQDYIGQLARAGHIDAQRIGGLWYVHMDSLLNYKQKADAYVPQPPQVERVNTYSDAIVTFDGKDYISAARAAEITGYHQDYVGQLARSGKIRSRQVGTRWYVDREELIEHKKEKDALLGAVQSQSVGIVEKADPEISSYEQKIEQMAPYRYSSDDGKELLPLQGKKEEEIVQVRKEETKEESDDEDNADDIAQQLRIRVIPERRQQMARPVFKVVDRGVAKIQQKNVRSSRNTMFYAAISGAVLVVLVVASIGSFIYYSQPKGNPAAAPSEPVVTVSEEGKQNGILAAIANILEPYVSRELIYKASQN